MLQEMTASYHKEHGKVAEGYTHDKEIAAIFVFSSPRDWVRTCPVRVTNSYTKLLANLTCVL